MKWKNSYRAHSSEIVVGGVLLGEVASAKLVALAVLNSIDPELLDAEVKDDRYMSSARGMLLQAMLLPTLDH